MRTDHLSYARLFKAALVGALLGLVFDLAVTFLTGPTRGFSVSQIPSSLAFLIVGFAGGWLFELFKAQSEVTDASVRTLAEVQDNVARLTRRMTYQDRALTMLLDVPRHNEVLTELIKASMNDNFRNIPDVGVAAYLRVLGLAVSHSERYEGIQRNPFRWYRDTDAGHYLDCLRDKPMSIKTRLVLVDDDDVDALEKDLASPEVMEYYWRHTGNVATYWMSVSDFRNAFPAREVPRDSALYDRQLLIAYDESRQLLKFDVLDDGNDMGRLFDDLQYISSRHAPALRQVQRPASVTDARAALRPPS